MRACVLLALLSAAVLGAEDCKDDHDNCVDWASAGECKKNPGFMGMTCPKSCDTCPKPVDPSLLQLGPVRVQMDVEGYGSITLGFYPNAAPVTVAHILKLFRLGCYDTNHIFRVDRGFVAQVQSVHSASVQTPLSAECKAESDKTVPAEFTNIRHVRGTLSMGRLADPDSGGSSFSMLLGRAAHLDNQYTVFGEVLDGEDVLAALETVETRKEGIFVMPKHRITITRATVQQRNVKEEF